MKLRSFIDFVRNKSRFGGPKTISWMVNCMQAIPPINQISGVVFESQCITHWVMPQPGKLSSSGRQTASQGIMPSTREHAWRELPPCSAASSPQITHPGFTCGHASRERQQQEAGIKHDGFTPTARDLFDRSDKC